MKRRRSPLRYRLKQGGLLLLTVAGGIMFGTMLYMGARSKAGHNVGLSAVLHLNDSDRLDSSRAQP